METVNYTDFRSNLKHWFDKVKDFEGIFRPKNVAPAKSQPREIAPADATSVTPIFIPPLSKNQDNNTLLNLNNAPALDKNTNSVIKSSPSTIKKVSDVGTKNK